MVKKPVLIFSIIVIAGVFSAFAFIQSARFAATIKSVISKNIPSDWGIIGDFTDFRIKIFPPGVAIHGAKVHLAANNILNLPESSRINAERIELKFYPLQMLSGSIHVNEIAVIGGDVQLAVDSSIFKNKNKEEKHKSWKLSWKELVHVKADALTFENTVVKFQMRNPDVNTSFTAQTFRLEQWKGGKGGVRLEMNISNVSSSFPKEWKIPAILGNLKTVVYFDEKGVKIDEIKAVTEGVEVKVTGKIKGNLLDPQKLLTKVDIEASGNADSMCRPLGLKIDTAGEVSFIGSLESDLMSFESTASVNGTLRVKNPRYKTWQADNLIAEGSWSPRELNIKQVNISGKEITRAGGSRPGYGGIVRTGPFKIQLENQPELYSVPLFFENAHLHWLGAPGLADVYPIDIRLNGSAEVKFYPGNEEKDWQLKAILALKIPRFVLDNQRLGQNKPQHYTLDIKDVSLAGEVIADSKEIRPEGLEVAMGKTKFQLGGDVNFKNGYNLIAMGSVDLADVGQIAQNTIRGAGRLDVHVRGPSEKVYIDFDAELADSEYLGLYLGDLKGLITWEDTPGNLIFNNVQLLKGRTQYTGDGRLELGDIEKCDLHFSIKKGDIHDYIQIFENITKDIWWFPSATAGSFRGEVDVTGGLSLNELKVHGRLVGNDWDFYGEKFARTSGEIIYDRGDYKLENVKAYKSEGYFTGRILYSKDGYFDWKLETGNLTFGDIDHIASMDVPIRGKLHLKSTGKGKQGQLQSDTRFVLDDVAVRGSFLSSSSAEMRTEGGILKLKVIANGGQGNLNVVYNFKNGEKSQINADLNQLDFSPLLLLLNPGLIHDPVLAGSISGKLNLNFKTGEADVSSGDVQLSDFYLAKNGAKFRFDKPVRFDVNHGTFDLENLSLKGEKGEVVFKLKGKNGLLNGRLMGDLDAGLVEFLSSTASKVDGMIGLDFDVGGKIKEPTIKGKALLSKVTVSVPSIDSPFEDISGVFELNQSVVSVKNLKAKLADGTVETNGVIELFANRFPRISLKSQLSGNKLNIYPFKLLKVQGGIYVHGETLPYAVDGDVFVQSGLCKEKFLQARSKGLSRVKYSPTSESSRQIDRPTFMLNIHAKADQGILVKNDLFDAELKGDVKLVNTIAVPRIVGDAEMIRGKLIFKDREMQIDSATIEFDNPAVINPKFDLTARTEVKATKIRLYASGRLDKWKAELSSDPVLPESEIFSLLAMGFTSEDLQKFGATDRSAQQGGAAFSLLLQSFDFNRDVRDKTGIQIQVQEAVDAREGSSIFRPSADATTGVAPKVVITRKLGKKVDLSVGSTVGVGTGAQKEVKAELKMTPSASVIGVWDNYEGVNVQENATSYGVDLKLQKGFK